MSHHEHEPLAGKRAGVMIGPLFEDDEATYPYYRLQEAGATVGVIGINGGETVKGKKGAEMTTCATRVPPGRTPRSSWTATWCRPAARPTSRSSCGR